MYILLFKLIAVINYGKFVRKYFEIWRIRICGFNFVTRNNFLAIAVLRIVHSK